MGIAAILILIGALLVSISRRRDLCDKSPDFKHKWEVVIQRTDTGQVLSRCSCCKDLRYRDPEPVDESAENANSTEGDE